uniref:Uncharacterized protein n=1 Tax=Anopheles maculatus TaxID=74869 RepID=A0A182T2J8_9DIPT
MCIKCSATANLHPCMRGYSSVHTQQPAGPIREYNIDPYILLEDELKYIFEDIRQEISRATNHQELNKIAVYYFDGQGKAFRPMVAILMAKALNYHMHNENRYARLGCHPKRQQNKRKNDHNKQTASNCVPSD